MGIRLNHGKIYGYVEAIDLRKGITGLIAIIQSLLNKDPISGDLFVFTNRSGKLMKCLYWDRTGYCLYVKKLEQGKFKLLSGELTEQQFELILDGISLAKRRQSR